MRKTTPTVSVPQVIKVAGFEANVNIQLKSYGSTTPTYYAGVAQVAKAASAILKAAGFTVLKSTSDSYSGGDSIHVTVKSELTDAQKEKNKALREWPVFVSYSSPEYHKEPRQALADSIIKAFQGGSFDGMQDLYEYRNDTLQVATPDGKTASLDTKYAFINFQ